MLTKQQVQQIATLARLGLSEKEKEKFQKELSSILDWVEQLSEVDTKKVEPMGQVTGLENVMREDIRIDMRIFANEFTNKEEAREALLKNAPMREGDYIKTRTPL